MAVHLICIVLTESYSGNWSIINSSWVNLIDLNGSSIQPKLLGILRCGPEVDIILHDIVIGMGPFKDIVNDIHGSESSVISDIESIQHQFVVVIAEIKIPHPHQIEDSLLGDIAKVIL